MTQQFLLGVSSIRSTHTALPPGKLFKGKSRGSIALSPASFHSGKQYEDEFLENSSNSHAQENNRK